MQKTKLITSHFYNRVIEGIEEELRDRSYNFRFNCLDPENFLIENIGPEKFAGMIVTSVYHEDFFEQIRNLGIPIVLLDSYFPHGYIDSVLVDNVAGVVEGLNYLKSLGHRRIAYIAGDVNDIGS